ncbi:MAG: 2-oxoacid:acceptor oxidoreductase family protein [Candidatus Lokiarchaeota archaeon]|nr:2-oxoacid:acceptor oxidoreductase family protein [Candidatus Lokiarchaeota archaeon]
MNRYEIHAVGLGGMGVIQLSKLITKAAVNYQGRIAVQTEAYSASARGGRCWADVVVELDEAERMIDYPKALSPYDFVFVLSEEAAGDVKKSDVKETGWVLWDSSIINKFRAAAKLPSLALPAQEMAIKEYGEAVIGSSILFGAFCSLSGILSKDAALKTLEESVPMRSADKNRAAFERGWGIGEKRKAEPRIAEKPEKEKKQAS